MKFDRDKTTNDVETVSQGDNGKRDCAKLHQEIQTEKSLSRSFFSPFIQLKNRSFSEKLLFLF